jgi:hypothetical protein
MKYEDIVCRNEGGCQENQAFSNQHSAFSRGVLSRVLETLNADG